MATSFFDMWEYFSTQVVKMCNINCLFVLFFPPVFLEDALKREWDIGDYTLFVRRGQGMSTR